ncbi:4Fe-4S ferredoxin, partial [Calditrichota bacterium]
QAQEDGKIVALLPSNVQEIREDGVLIEVNGEEMNLPNDQVFIMIGGEMPFEFLKNAGIDIQRKFGEK